MTLDILFDQAGLVIGYDESMHWLYANWRGAHTQASVRQGCLGLLRCLQQRPCSKILADNSNVVQISAVLTDWGRCWLADMHGAGLCYLAWVFPPNYQTRYHAERLVLPVQQPVIATFDDLASAYEWLRRQGRPPAARGAAGKK